MTPANQPQPSPAANKTLTFQELAGSTCTKLTLKSFVVTLVLILCAVARADTVTLVTSQSTARFDVPSNVVAEVVHVYGSYAYSYTVSGQNNAVTNNTDWSMEVTAQNKTVVYSSAIIGLGFPVPNYPYPKVVGPATIKVTDQPLYDPTTDTLLSSTLICTIQTSPAAPSPPTTPNAIYLPSNTVVVPADNGGPVTIVLESSTDLVNWAAALPGSYGTTTTNRFFRVRATR
jgi:hypothetical protein